MPDVLTLWTLAVFAIGGAMYLVMGRASTSSTRAIDVVDLAGSRAGVLEAVSLMPAAASALATHRPYTACT